jgi:hypothetical protein
MAATPKPTPRWLYAFFEFIERLPIPAWLLGLLVILVGSLVFHLEAWRQGLLPNGVLDSYLVTLSLYPVVMLAAWIFLDNRARTALTSFSKNKWKRLAGLERLIADFISLPSWLAPLAFLGGFVGGYFNYQLATDLSPLAGKVFPGYDLLGFLLVSGLVSMTVTRAVLQAVKLHRLLQDVEVNIFNPAPLYALSRYASQSTLTLLVLNYSLILISLPGFLFTVYGFTSLVLVMTPTFILFFAPLRGVNRRMRDEKDRLVAELGKDLDEVFAAAHQAARRKDYARLDKMRNAASILKDGWEIARKIPTWPWEPETVRNLVVTLLFPVIVYLVQRFTGSLIGF